VGSPRLGLRLAPPNGDASRFSNPGLGGAPLKGASPALSLVGCLDPIPGQQSLVSPGFLGRDFTCSLHVTLGTMSRPILGG
jgi:hypothetical protein